MATAAYPPSPNRVAPSQPGYAMRRRSNRLAGLFFVFVTVIAVAGARLSSGASLEGFLRSVQLIDLALPYLAAIVLFHFATITGIVGRRVINAGFLFLLFAGFSSVVGHFVVDEGPGLSVVGLSVLFFVKEIEFFLVLGFAALVAFDHPVIAWRTLAVACVFLAVWAIKELIFPTGLYYVGLPFEGGPSQAGAVYAIFVFVWCVIVAYRWAGAGRVFRYLIAPTVFALLVAGNLGSLSRTGQAGLLAGLAIMMLARTRNWPITLVVVPMMYLVYALAFTDAQSVLDFGIASRWSGAADNFPDRVVKWVAMIDFQRDNPLSFFTGCGFNSPNRYVLYQFANVIDLGNVLAVDNGYVRRVFEIGIIGTALYFLFLGRLFLALWKTRFAPFAAGAFVAMATIAVAIESFQVTQTAIAFFLFCGVTFGIAAREKMDAQSSRA